MAPVKLGQAIALYPNNRQMIETYIATDIMGELLPGVSMEN